MAQTSQRSTSGGVLTSLGMAQEVTYGTPVVPTYFVGYESHDLAVSNKILTNAVVRHSIGQPPPGIGSVGVAGTIVTLLDDTSGPLLSAAFGAGCDTTTASGALFQHVLHMKNPLNSYTYSADDNQNNIQAFTGCKIESAQFACKAGDFLRATFTVKGKTAVVSTGTLSPSFGTHNFYEFAHMSQAAGGNSLLNGAVFDVTDFNITMAANLKERFGSTSGRTAINFNETTRNVKLTFSLEYDNVSGVAVNQYMWGTPTGPAAGTIARLPAAFTFVIPASGGGVESSISFSLGQILISDVKISRSRNNILTMAVTAEASETQVGGVGQADDLVCTIMNGTSTSY